MGVIELFDFGHELSIGYGDNVDSDSLSSESTRTSDSVDIGFLFLGKIVIDDQRNLLDVDSSGEQIGGNKDSDFSLSELLHDLISLFLWGLSVHHLESESVLLELLGDGISISLLIDVDDGLLNLDVLVELLESWVLPGFLLDGNEELLDTVKSEVFVLDSDDDW